MIHENKVGREQAIKGDLSIPTPVADGSCGSTGIVGQTEIRVKGQAVLVPSVKIDGITVIRTGAWLRVATIQDEDLLEGGTLSDPAYMVERLQESKLGADIFSFAQKLPETESKYSYHSELENFAVIPITTFSDWWDKRVESSVRRAVRKANKAGVSVRVVTFDDAFIDGIVSINNETPVRQGRRFWHYQKAFSEVKKENLTYRERNVFLGAYYEERLIGYMRMTYSDKVANIVQLLSMIKHYDKRPANALIAKAVETCAEHRMSYLMYYNYIYNDPDSSLTEFKRRNGFEKIELPRYYAPLTVLGKLGLRLGLHKRLTKRIPAPLLVKLLKTRNRWYASRLRSSEGTL